MDKLFSNYEGKFSGQMIKFLSKSIIKIYSVGTCVVLRVSNEDTLSEDLEPEPFLNSALQRFMCELYYRFVSLLAPLSIGMIMSRHYLSEQNATDTKNGRRTNEGESGDEQTAIN